MNTNELKKGLNPPFLSENHSGIGGTIRTFPEDFEVEEIPAYEPCGNGEFLYLWIEKKELGAEYFVRQIARRLEIKNEEVGTAGLKDRHAITRQQVSVPARVEERLPQLDGDGIRVLKINRHTNKIKSGHLRGNRFRILIRDVQDPVTVEECVQNVVNMIRDNGLPNFYGPQRFGHEGETAQVGLALLRGDNPTPAEGKRKYNARNPFFRKFALSAAQSVLFNDYLSCRMKDGFFRKVLAGDVMSKWPMGGLFVSEDVRREQERFDARETVTTGPIFGRKTFAAASEAAQRETHILTKFGLGPESFRSFGKLTLGTRRHNLVYVDDLTFTREREGIRLRFTLPAGSYATVLLREIMKTEIPNTEKES